MKIVVPLVPAVLTLSLIELAVTVGSVPSIVIVTVRAVPLVPAALAGVTVRVVLTAAVVKVSSWVYGLVESAFGSVGVAV
jgi:high-affinity K+ transport system ATPase subunit B